MSDNVIPFEAAQRDRAEMAARRFKTLYVEARTLDQLPPELGAPEEWLTSAIVYLKTEMSKPEYNGRTITVSGPAVELLIWHIEALENGGEPWGGNAA
ncbi:hypothetical protein [Sphingobium sp. CFD-1]|uniref:hypothetical protein n=1 Tax=Sphingobium sp. CFD-1 TaxID=2878545 RepID=UPI00214B102C|nr:hypothetical protein [Sphingobium sp. CFD-1]